MGDWVGILIVLAWLVTLVILARESVRHQFHAELSRKVIHVGMSAVLLSLPWMFRAIWPVVFLAVVGGVGLLLLQKSVLWRNGAGKALCEPGRAPWGEPCYALGGCLMFLIYIYGGEEDANKRLALYLIPILLLGIADAVAALVGSIYGRWAYAIGSSRKTVEGCFAFVFVGTICGVVPLVVFLDATFIWALLVAFVVSLGTAMVEAVVGHGVDNVVVPCVGYVMLRCWLDGGVLLGVLMPITFLVPVLLIWYTNRHRRSGTKRECEELLFK